MEPFRLLAFVLLLFWFGPDEALPQNGETDTTGAQQCASLTDVMDALDRYLNSDRAELARRAGAGRSNYAGRYVDCLTGIIQRLPPGNTPYDTAVALRAYFSAVDYRVHAEEILNVDTTGAADSLLRLGLAELNGLDASFNPAYVSNERGIIYELLDSFSRAREQYRAALDTDTDFALAYVNLANVELAIDPQANRDSAEVHYREALRKSQDRLATAHLGLGNMLVESNKTRKDGLMHLNTANQMLGSVPEVQYGYGRGLVINSKRSDGRKQYEKAADNSSGRVKGVARYALGRSYLKGSRKEARKQYEQAVTALANDTTLREETLIELGQAYNTFGAGGKGRKFFRQKINSGKAGAGVYAAYAILGGADWDEKIEAVARRRNPGFIRRVAVGVYQSGKPRRAGKIAKIGVETHSLSVAAYRTYLDILIIRNKLSQACNLLASAETAFAAAGRPKRFNRLLCFISTNPGGDPDFYNSLRGAGCWKAEWSNPTCPRSLTLTDE